MKKSSARRSTRNASATHQIHADGTAGNSTGGSNPVSSKWANKFGNPSGTAVLAESSKLSEASESDKGGRPTKYDPAYCDKVIAWGRMGYTIEQIAVELKINTQTLYNWKAAHEEFLEAIEEAVLCAQAFMEKLALDALSSDKEFKTTLWSKIVSCRFPHVYRDTTRNEHSGPEGKPIPLAVANAPMTGEGLRDYYKQFMDKAVRSNKNVTPV